MKKVDENNLSELKDTENKELTELSADEEVAASSDIKALSVPEEKPLE
jgi:hypothetical protein